MLVVIVCFALVVAFHMSVFGKHRMVTCTHTSILSGIEFLSSAITFEVRLLGGPGEDDPLDGDVTSDDSRLL